jgi:phage shock protein A
MQEESLIRLLSETLKFYAEPAVYKNNQINLDGGYLARFALEQVKRVDEKMDKLQTAYDELKDEISEKTPDEIQKIIQQFKDIK